MNKENIIRMSQEAGFKSANYPSLISDADWNALEKFYKAAYAAGVNVEREECAKVCEQSNEDGEGPDCWDWHSKDYAAAIRARGQHEP